MPAVITSLQHLGPVQKRLFDGVYGSLYRAHGDVRQNVERPSPEVAARVAITSGYPRQLALQMAAAQHEYRKFIGRLSSIQAGPEGTALTTALACMPPLSRFNGIQDVFTCRKFDFCPACRYRMLASLHARLLPASQHYAHMGVLNIRVSSPSNRIPDVGVQRFLTNHMRNIYSGKRNKWPVDVNILLPRQKDDHSKWTLQMSIIAFADDLANFIDPQKLGSLNAWEIRAADELSLAAALADCGQYQAATLFTTWPAEEMANIYEALHKNETRKLQLHGLRRLRPTVPTLVNTQNTEENEIDNVISFCRRPAPEAADVEQQT